MQRFEFLATPIGERGFGRQRGNVDQRIADSFAESCFENIADFGFENDPEGAADCEMSYWND